MLILLHKQTLALQQLHEFVTLLSHPLRSSLMSERVHFSKQIEVLVSSHALRHSESLCKLLRYLAKHALEQPGVSLKEYQIATEVFGRRPDFDPQTDSTIRVQAGRLRAKLSEYYGTEGVEDPILVELPKGTYVLEFHRRTLAEAKVLPAGSNAKAWATGAAKTSPNRMTAIVALGVLFVAALGLIGSLLTFRKAAEADLKTEVEPAPPEFREFWKPFLTGAEEPWVVFSNAAFVGRPETGMRYYNPAQDSARPIWDHYSGVGEVLAVHELDQVFALLHHRIRVKRGSLFSLDDVRNNDLIFLGSPSENLTLTEIPGTRQFVFQRLIDGPRKGDLGIINVHPHGDEARVFLASPSTSPLVEDYAVIAFTPGLDPKRSVMMFAGTTTFGTQAAVEYVCRQSSLRELLSRLSVSQTGFVKPFEALLRVKVTRGVPVEAELLAVRQPGS